MVFPNTSKSFHLTTVFLNNIRFFLTEEKSLQLKSFQLNEFSELPNIFFRTASFRKAIFPNMILRNKKLQNVNFLNIFFSNSHFPNKCFGMPIFQLIDCQSLFAECFCVLVALPNVILRNRKLPNGKIAEW